MKNINIQVIENFKNISKDKRNKEIENCIIKHILRSIKSS